MATSRILVTGASGFVGRALCNTLVSTGADVRAAVRCTDSAGHIPCPSIALGSIDAHTDWSSALEGVDLIAHLAARAHVMREDLDPLSVYRRINVDATERLAKQAASAGVRRFVFVSSIKVNGESTTTRAFTERDPPKPQDAYGASKLEAEQRLAQISKGTGLEVSILRPPLVYGAGAKGNLLSLMRAVDRGYPLPIGAIHNRRSLVGLNNLIAAIMLCLEHPNAAGSTFLVADEPAISSADLARAIGAALGRNARLLPMPETMLRALGVVLGRSAAVARLTSSLTVDSTSIRHRLGWEPVQSFTDGIRDMVHRYRLEKSLE